MTRSSIRPTAAASIFVLIALGLLAVRVASADGPAPATDAVASSAAVELKRGVRKPRIVTKRIPFGAERKRQMANYSKRHYGKREWRLKKPRVIVQHYSVTPDIPSLYNVFASNRPDPEFGELPNVCAHFGVGRTGRIFQFVGLGARCRHTVGLNYTSIGIEHVGYSDSQVLSNARQMRGSLKLSRWLRCVYDIPVKDVIGHNESLRSRYHRERVDELKTATHGDFRRKSMNRYRRQLRQAGRC